MPLATPTPKSSATPRTRRSSGTFSDRIICADSATDVDTESTDSGEDGSVSSDSDNDDMSDTTRILESHLFSLLHFNLNVAARLVPRIHYLVNNEYEAGFGRVTKLNDEEKGNGAGKSGPDTQRPSQDSSSRMVGRDASFNKRPQKHDRDSGESDGEEKNDNFKKPRRDGGGDPDDDPSAGESSREPQNFACHFHKLNPIKYGPWADKRYEKCTGSRIPEIRRIKSVLNSNPSTSQLNLC
jgi:hypothetical protein